MLFKMVNVRAHQALLVRLLTIPSTILFLFAIKLYSLPTKYYFIATVLLLTASFYPHMKKPSKYRRGEPTSINR